MSGRFRKSKKLIYLLRPNVERNSEQVRRAAKNKACQTIYKTKKHPNHQNKKALPTSYMDLQSAYRKLLCNLLFTVPAGSDGYWGTS